MGVRQQLETGSKNDGGGKSRAIRKSGQKIMKTLSELLQSSIKGISTQLLQEQCALK